VDRNEEDHKEVRNEEARKEVHNAADIDVTLLPTVSVPRIDNNCNAKNAHADSVMLRMSILTIKMRNVFSALCPSKGKLFRAESLALALDINVNS
jgi:hypothetical protein